MQDNLFQQKIQHSNSLRALLLSTGAMNASHCLGYDKSTADQSTDLVNIL